MHVDIIAEIGINHNGDINIAKELIDIASVAGCDYVKFQKREPELCVPENQKDKPKTVPWREEPTTYLQYKKDIEFGREEYEELFDYAHTKGVEPFASVWDIPSANFMRSLTNICKIPSALITDIPLLHHCRNIFKSNMISTGMSTEEEIEKAVKSINPDVIFHTNSVYPSPVEDLNLGYIVHLKEKYGKETLEYSINHGSINAIFSVPQKVPLIGYSNHFYGITPCFASVALGAEFIEVHVTKDHRMWGSDQASSVEPVGLFKLVRGIRDLEKALEGNKDRCIYAGEEKKRETLRGV